MHFTELLISFYQCDSKSVVFWLVNTSSSNNKTNHDMWGNTYIYRKSIYKWETVSNKNIGLVDRVRMYFNNRNGSSGLTRRLISDWSELEYLLHDPPKGQVWHKAFF